MGIDDAGAFGAVLRVPFAALTARFDVAQRPDQVNQPRVEGRADLRNDQRRQRMFEEDRRRGFFVVSAELLTDDAIAEVLERCRYLTSGRQGQRSLRGYAPQQVAKRDQFMAASFEIILCALHQRDEHIFEAGIDRLDLNVVGAVWGQRSVECRLGRRTDMQRCAK